MSALEHLKFITQVIISGGPHGVSQQRLVQNRLVELRKALNTLDDQTTTDALRASIVSLKATVSALEIERRDVALELSIANDKILDSQILNATTADMLTDTKKLLSTAKATITRIKKKQAND